MKNFALYDETGKIQKVISTTKGKDFIELNLKGLQYIKVDSEVTTNSHKIIDGKPLKQEIIPIPEPDIPIPAQPGITDEDIDKIKDIEDVKTILKQMIGPKTFRSGMK
jgi:hypothetical protein